MSFFGGSKLVWPQGLYRCRYAHSTNSEQYPCKNIAALLTVPYSYVREGFGHVIPGQCSATYSSRQEKVKAP
jgi:hypothetical protein